MGEWQNNVAVDGSIRVVSTNATRIAITTAANQLTLSWAADHVGWRLQVQTNYLMTGLNTNWLDVPNAAATNLVALPISAGNSSIFYRLIFP